MTKPLVKHPGELHAGTGQPSPACAGFSQQEIIRQAIDQILMAGEGSLVHNALDLQDCDREGR